MEKVLYFDVEYANSTNKDILIIGDYESQAYAHGNYGTKVRRAMELNSKGSNISIIKEADFFKQTEKELLVQ